MRANIQNVLAAAALAILCFGATACGNNVSGHTYAGPGNMVKIEFQSGGKANTSFGAMTAACTYTENGKKISLVCEGDTTDLTMADDGSLTGPPDGMLARLTKIK